MNLLDNFAQSAGALEYIECFSGRGGKTPPHNDYRRYDIKQSDDLVPVMLELWGMWSTPSLPFLSGQLSEGVLAPD